MRLIELSDAATFLQRSSRLLLESEAENNLLLSSARTLARSAITRSSRLSFFVAESSGNIVGSALNASDRRLLLSTTTLEAAAFMGDQFAARDLSIKGVLGPSEPARVLSQRIGKAKGLSLVERSSQLVLRLESVIDQPVSKGLFRVAKEKDFKLLLDWSTKFVEECGLDEPLHETEEVIRRYLENRQLYVWEDVKPVAMAGFGGFTPNGVRVNMVYADRQSRGRGYASSVVQLLSRKLMRENERRFCFLFVDTTNDAANRIYEKIGYRRVGAFSEFRVEPADETSQLTLAKASGSPENDLTVNFASHLDSSVQA